MIPGIAPIVPSRAKGPIAVTQVASAGNPNNQTVNTFSSLSFGAEPDFPAERAIVIATGGLAASAGVVSSSVTVAGVAANKVVEAEASAFDNASLWITNAPRGTSGDVVITFSSSMDSAFCVVYRMVGMESISAHDTAIDVTPAGGAVAASIDCPADGVIIGTSHFFWNTTSTTAITSWTNLTEDIDANLQTNARNYSAAHNEFAMQQTARTITAAGSGGGAIGGGKLAVASWSPAPR